MKILVSCEGKKISAFEDKVVLCFVYSPVKALSNLQHLLLLFWLTHHWFLERTWIKALLMLLTRNYTVFQKEFGIKF